MTAQQERLVDSSECSATRVRTVDGMARVHKTKGLEGNWGSFERIEMRASCAFTYVYTHGRLVVADRQRATKPVEIGAATGDSFTRGC